MALQSSLSSSSSVSYGFSYDVFLSFRGTDTRYGFTGNFYRSLCDRGIRTFFDDRELQGGDEITPSLFKAIEDSRFFIPVFSINYASSSFCLDELVHIMECSKARGRVVLPVFYGVDPSHVRHQTDSYGEALAEREERFQDNKESYSHNMERLQKWKMALTQAANLSGHHFKIGNEYEHEFIGNIVKYVSNKISRVPLHVAKYPVGLESRVLHVKSLLDERSDDGVYIIGIYGIGGVGKTTLAKAIYNFIADQFECLCFLHNVRENSAKHDLKHLQEMLLSKTVGLDIQLGNVSEGIPIIKQRLCQKKVLLIVDDVDKPEQLQVLTGGRDWFGLGSNVIITTRNKHLLASHEIKRTYEVDGLNGEEALELLRWKAFKSDKVDPCYEYILNRAVTYASGLPLALEVVGSNLFGKSIEHWESALDRYRKIPNNEIQKILKVSFDALEKDEQSVFLDIACCFKGHSLAEVEEILHAHYGDNMKYHIGVLVEKSLIKIDMRHMTLHDLIEDMGKEIVRQESPREPGKRSRLWFHEDIVQVLEENKGTSLIEIIYLNFPLFEEVELKGDEFKKMENLKTLIIKGGRFSRGPEHFPSSLRVLEWHRYPSQDIPSDFCPKKLSICKLPKSYATSFDLPSSLMAKRLVNMTDLNFDWCQHLTQIPDVSGLPNLEKFSFHGCGNLIAIHDSIGHLNKLKILNACDCGNLRSFPPLRLTSLQELKLSYCFCLENFPEILREMENLTQIDLEGTSVKELPSSIENLTRLRTLVVLGCGGLRLPNTILMMPELSKLDVGGCQLPKQNDKTSSVVSSNIDCLSLADCKLSNECLPTVLGWFANVTYLNLRRNDFTILPECLKECHYLMGINLDECERLREIRGMQPKLKFLSAEGCRSLTSSCRSNLLNQELHEAGGTWFCLHGTARIPEWFEHQSRGPSISFWFRNKLPSVALLVVSKSMDEYQVLKPNLIINGCNYNFPQMGIPFYRDVWIFPYHTYLLDLQLHDNHWEFGSEFEEALSKNEWNHVELTLEEDREWYTKSGNTLEFNDIEMGIHIFKQKSRMKDIEFTKPHKIGNEYEHKFIGNIVKYVSNKISRVPLHVADYPVGLESRVLHVTSLLDEPSDDGVHIIGIYGTGGVGKTTLAKAIYNFIADQFECLCFLHNVRENSSKHDLKRLQEMLLSKTVGLDIQLGNVSEGIPIIKQRLRQKKVLLIVDDVDKPEQLQVLAGGRDWFGLGSNVIITTRNKHLLASHEIKRTYEVDGLNGEEALELLRWKAFKSDKVDPCYEYILNRAVTYASGLPLALEVVGSDLFGKPIERWESALDRYRRIPNNEIQNILKISFDALEKDEQSVFLDIACCFKGYSLAEVENILRAHYGDNKKYHIGVLVEKSLIKIDKWHWSNYTDHVTLHDLIEDMGKEIVDKNHQESLGNAIGCGSMKIQFMV